MWIPVHRNWRLNERHYGALQGLDKAETKAKYGEEQFMAWRRSYDTPPPPIEKGSKYSQDADPRYADIDGGPLTECLADVVARFVPYYEGIVPARFPVHVGSTQANLLLPLYGVVVVAALALAWQLYGDDVRVRELGPLSWPLALLVGWSGVSILWTKDVRQGAIELLFFVLPFGLLAVVLARLPWSRLWVLVLYVQLAVMGLVFAAIGIVQYEERQIFWNPKVKVDNAYAPSGWFYRVNSVFYDPSIYGRFLVVAILASLAVVLRRRGRDPLWAVAATLVLAITWVGLLPSFSQSSYVALMAGVTVAAIVVWRWRSLVLLGVAAAVLVLAVAASPQLRHRIQGKTSSSLSHVTSGRSTLARNGVKLAVHHPVLGVGIGGFKRAYADANGAQGS